MFEVSESTRSDVRTKSNMSDWTPDTGCICHRLVTFFNNVDVRKNYVYMGDSQI